MQNKNKLFGLMLAVLAVCVIPYSGYAETDEFEDLDDEDVVFVEDDTGDVVETVSLNIDSEQQAADALSAAAVATYNVEGSVFQMITDLEQQKVLMELEKERAQLDLDLDRLAAEKIKLQMEMDTLSGRAEQEQQILQNEKSRLEAEAAKIEQERQKLLASEENDNNGYYASNKESTKKSTKKVDRESDDQDDIASMYKLVNVMGAGNQLQATLSDLETGQTKRVTVGKKIDGFTVKSISLEDGVVFVKDGESQNLNISSR